MKTGLLNITLILGSIILFNSCNQDEFYKKDYLKEMFPTPEKDRSLDPTKNVEPPVLTDSNTNNPNVGNNINNPNVGNNTNNPNIPPVDQTNPTPIPTTPNPASCQLKTITENFSTQGTSPKVDILWVIDNSGSMGDEQNNLRRNLDSFINKFLSKNVDFKMAITTTDDKKIYSGKVNGKLDFLTSAKATQDLPSFLSAFKRWTQVGTWGSGREKGFNTTLNFLNRYSTNFLRSDAYFIPIYLSDEEEQSGYSISKYIEALAKYKTVDKIRSYSIVSSYRRKHTKWETEGQRYEFLSNELHGQTLDIHDNFADSLDVISTNIVEINKRFKLKYKVEGEVNVTVDDKHLVNNEYLHKHEYKKDDHEEDKEREDHEENESDEVELNLSTNVKHNVKVTYNTCL